MSQLKCSVEVVSLLIKGHPVSFRKRKMNRRASGNFEIFWQDWTCLCMFYVHAFELRMFLQIYVQRVVYEVVLTFLFGEARWTLFPIVYGSDMGRHMSKRFARFSANWVRRRLVSSHMRWSLVEASSSADLRVVASCQHFAQDLSCRWGPFKIYVHATKCN